MTPAEDGHVRLRCPRGLVNDRAVPSADVTAAEVVPERLLQQLARGSEIEFLFDRERRAGRVVAFGRIPWLDGNTACFAVGLGRHDATSALVAAAALGSGPFLVLLPPSDHATHFDGERLRALGIRVVPTDTVMDWRNLELRRAQLHVATAAQEVREEQAEYGSATLVLDAKRCQAFSRGRELRLTRLQWFPACACEDSRPGGSKRDHC